MTQREDGIVTRRFRDLAIPIVGWTLLLLGFASSLSMAQEQILSGRIPSST
jgi:hypothetical protein